MRKQPSQFRRKAKNRGAAALRNKQGHCVRGVASKEDVLQTPPDGLVIRRVRQDVELLVADRREDHISDLAWRYALLPGALKEFLPQLIVKRACFVSTWTFGEISRAIARRRAEARTDPARAEHRDLDLGADLLQFQIQGLGQRDDR